MAESKDTQAKTDSRERSSRNIPAPAAVAAAPVAATEGLAGPLVDLLGADFSEATFQHHAALLGDGRLSHRSNAGQRAVVVRRLQRDYGNAYVQRLVSHVNRAQGGEANRPLADSPLVQAAQEEDRRGEDYQAGPETSDRIEELRGSGSPMEPETRQEMETTFGRDLGGVRIHTGSEADQLNKEVSAEAFTTGNDIFFAAGNYAPESQQGTELLAHELTHVVQQNGAHPQPETPSLDQRPPVSQRPSAPRATQPVSLDQFGGRGPDALTLSPAAEEGTEAAEELSYWEEAKKWAFKKALAAAGIPVDAVMGLLNKAGPAIMNIIKEPGRFVSTLIGAIGQGFRQFSANIGDHLQKGFVSWLFGNLSKAGISLPPDFSLKSILDLALQVLGITADFLKKKLAKLIGEKNVERIEKAWGYLSTFINEGEAGLWELLKGYLGNLKELVVGQIQDWLIENVIKAGALKVLGMFNPVSGLITIIKTIYNVIKFLVERGQQIISVFGAIVDSVADLAAGKVGPAAKKVEEALARAIPVAIGFMASLLGLGGVSEKIKEIIQGIREKVIAAINAVLEKIAKFFMGQGRKADVPGRVESEGDEKKEHAEMAQAVLKEMSTPPSEEMVYEDLRRSKKEQAKVLENKYNSKLKKPIKMTITFRSPEEDKKDGDLDFHIHIGPNNTDKDGEVAGGIFGPLGKAFTWATEKVAGAVSGGVEALKSTTVLAADAVVSKVKGAADAVASAAESVRDALVTAVGAKGEAATTARETFVSKTKTLVGAIQSTGEKSLDWMAEKASWLGEKLKEGAARAFDGGMMDLFDEKKKDLLDKGWDKVIKSKDMNSEDDKKRKLLEKVRETIAAYMSKHFRGQRTGNLSATSDMDVTFLEPGAHQNIDRAREYLRAKWFPGADDSQLDDALDMMLFVESKGLVVAGHKDLTDADKRQIRRQKPKIQLNQRAYVANKMARLEDAGLDKEGILQEFANEAKELRGDISTKWAEFDNTPSNSTRKLELALELYRETVRMNMMIPDAFYTAAAYKRHVVDKAEGKLGESTPSTVSDTALAFGNMVYEAGRILPMVEKALPVAVRELNDFPYISAVEYAALAGGTKKALRGALGKLISYAKQAHRAFEFAHNLGVAIQNKALVLASQALEIKKKDQLREIFPWEAPHFLIIWRELGRLKKEVIKKVNPGGKSSDVVTAVDDAGPDITELWVVDLTGKLDAKMTEAAEEAEKQTRRMIDKRKDPTNVRK